MNIDDLHDAGFNEGYGTIINHSLGEYADDNKDVIATVYVYSTVSVNGGNPHNADFFGVVGNRKEKLLDIIKSTFILSGHQRSRNIWIRNSDYVRFNKDQSIYHIEDGRLWKQEDAICWFTNDEWADRKANKENNIENGEVVTPLDDFRAEEESPRRRQIRGDARVRTAIGRIEEEYGLPQGSVVLTTKPDGNPIRTDAKVSHVTPEVGREGDGRLIVHVPQVDST